MNQPVETQTHSVPFFAQAARLGALHVKTRIKSGRSAEQSDK